MTEFIAEIRSDAQGHPVPNGPDYHYVLFSDNPVAVAQMHAGGALPENDCADADTEAVFIRRGIHVPIRDVEAEEQTSRGGTLLQYIAATLVRNGVPARVVLAPPPADANKVMNSAYDYGNITADIGPYLAAYIGWGVQIDDPAPAANTQPTTGGQPTPEDDMFSDADRALLQQIANKQGGGVVVFFQCQGATFKSTNLETWEWMPSQSAINDARAVAIAEGFTVRDWPGGNVADPFAFGDPKTQHDADVAKVTFPH